MYYLSIDWAKVKNLAVYDSKTGKVSSVSSTIGAFELFLEKVKGSPAFLFEQGGGDSFKLLAIRTGYKVFVVPGKRIKDFRDSLDEEKSTDEVDAFLIGKYYERHPEDFREFNEDDREIAELKLIFRAYMDLQKDSVRNELRRQALETKFELANVNGKNIERVQELKLEAVKTGKKEAEQLKKVMDELIKKFSITEELQKIKGIGTVVIGGFISELGGRGFESFPQVRKYAGMITKKGNPHYNRYLKTTLFHAMQGFIKNGTPGWREKYDVAKVKYQEREPEWSKGKCHAYAMKNVETEFLEYVWNLMSK